MFRLKIKDFVRIPYNFFISSSLASTLFSKKFCWSHVNRRYTKFHTVTRRQPMKLTFSYAIACLAAIASTEGYKVIGGSVTSKKIEVAKLDIKSSSNPSIPIDSNRDSFVVNVNFEKAEKPKQLLFLLSNNKGLDHSVYARYVDADSKASASIVVSKLPMSLKVQEEIFVSVVAAGTSETEENVLVPLFSFVPSDLFKTSLEYTAPVRLGALPEIHHQFRADVALIGSFIPTVFSAGALALLLVLLVAWATLVKGNMFSDTQGAFWKLGYLATLGYFEVIVMRYYLGSSIFATLAQGAIVAGPLAFFGSRALTSLARLRR